MTEQQVLSLLQQHVPEPAVRYCLQLWQEKPFTLKITRSRLTKIGDFTSKRNAARPQITLNADLNPYTFLVTYIHEVAHLFVFLNFSRNTEPHGEHWKYAFRRLMSPMLTPGVFPEEILIPLMDHMENPKASSFADVTLTRALRSFDADAKEIRVLSDIPEGSIFKLHDRYFQKGKLRRTRVLCKEMNSKRQYLVPAEAEVSDVQLSLL
ncbi:MAG TPA: SprT-like domain-containing protein [Cyclobacteriaceae bacterium]|nr:SprT-like domain-containing protein [Cyclobacteriaceae bacterium]